MIGWGKRWTAKARGFRRVSASPPRVAYWFTQVNRAERHETYLAGYGWVERSRPCIRCCGRTREGTGARLSIVTVGDNISGKEADRWRVPKEMWPTPWMQSRMQSCGRPGARAEGWRIGGRGSIWLGRSGGGVNRDSQARPARCNRDREARARRLAGFELLGSVSQKVCKPPPLRSDCGSLTPLGCQAVARPTNRERTRTGLMIERLFAPAGATAQLSGNAVE